MELLVVIAIISVLAALMFPVLSRMQAQSRSAECMSNLRQIGAAIQMFANDRDGLVIPAVMYLNDGTEVTWTDGLAPYLVGTDNIIAKKQRAESVFACPAETKKINHGNKADYGLNIRINAKETDPFLYRLQNVPVPSKTIIVGDAVNREIANWKEYPLEPRHSGCANLLYLDFHIEPVDPATIPKGENLLPWMPMEETPP